jgi:hypothetical protein
MTRKISIFPFSQDKKVVELQVHSSCVWGRLKSAVLPIDLERLGFIQADVKEQLPRSVEL